VAVALGRNWMLLLAEPLVVAVALSGWVVHLHPRTEWVVVVPGHIVSEAVVVVGC
jgi:hypothetical protein